MPIRSLVEMLLSLFNMTAIGLSAVLAIVLWLGAEGQSKLAGRALSTLVLVSGYIVFVMISYQTGWIAMFPALIGTQSPLVFLPGPLIACYVVFTVGKQRPDAWLLVHFVPFMAYLVWLWPVLSLSGDAKLQNVMLHYYESSPQYERTQLLHMTLALGHFAAYLLAARWYLTRHALAGDAVVGKICWLFCLVWMVFFVRMLVDTFTAFTTADTALLAHSSISILLFVICIRALYGTSSWWLPTPVGNKYQRAGLEDEHLRAVANAVNDALRKDKLFTYPGLSLDDLAKTTGFSRHQISQALNGAGGLGFAALLRQLRLDEARRLIAERSELSLGDIALQAGFSGRSSFYNAFQREKGVSPSKYRRKLVQSDGFAPVVETSMRL